MRQNSKRFRLDVWGWTTIVILLLYALFLLYPLSLLLKMAFSDGVHFTLENFAKFFSRKYYSITLLNSFKVSHRRHHRFGGRRRGAGLLHVGV